MTKLRVFTFVSWLVVKYNHRIWIMIIYMYCRKLFEWLFSWVLASHRVRFPVGTCQSPPHDLSRSTVNTRTCKCWCLGSWQMLCKCYSAYILVQFMCVQLFMYVHVNHALGGAMSQAFSIGCVLNAHMLMFRIAINKLFEWFSSRVLASHLPGSITGRAMSVLGPLV